MVLTARCDRSSHLWSFSVVDFLSFAAPFLCNCAADPDGISVRLLSAAQEVPTAGILPLSLAKYPRNTHSTIEDSSSGTTRRL